MLKKILSYRIVLLLLFFVAIGHVCQAQPGDPQTDPDVPISGIEILIGLGALFGAKKFLDHRKQKG